MAQTESAGAFVITPKGHTVWGAAETVCPFGQPFSLPSQPQSGPQSHAKVDRWQETVKLAKRRGKHTGTPHVQSLEDCLHVNERIIGNSRVRVCTRSAKPRDLCAILAWTVETNAPFVRFTHFQLLIAFFCCLSRNSKLLADRCTCPCRLIPAVWDWTGLTVVRSPWNLKLVSKFSSVLSISGETFTAIVWMTPRINRSVWCGNTKPGDRAQENIYTLILIWQESNIAGRNFFFMAIFTSKIKTQNAVWILPQDWSFQLNLFSLADTINWPTAGCKFADYLEDVNWIDLSGKHYYLLSKKQSTITVAYKRTSASKPYTKYAFRCVAIRKHNMTNDEYTYITHASHGW